MTVSKLCPVSSQQRGKRGRGPGKNTQALGVLGPRAHHSSELYLRISSHAQHSETLASKRVGRSMSIPLLSFVCCSFCFMFETRSHYVAPATLYVDQAGPKLTEFLVLELKACNHCARQCTVLLFMLSTLQSSPSNQTELVTVKAEQFPLA